jgi:hypothetical protein
MKKMILLVSFGLLGAVFLPVEVMHPQSVIGGSVASDLERPLHRCEQQVASWQRAEILEIGFLVATIAIGVIIAGVQASKNNLVKNVTVVLGIVSAILTGINSTLFPADVKALRRAIFDGNAAIDQLWIKVHAAENLQLSAPDSKDSKTALDDYVQSLNHFKAVGDALTGPSVAKASTTGFHAIVSVVYAQSGATLPTWTRQAPSDTATARYFVGKSSAPSLTAAKQFSADAALYNAIVALIPIAPNVSRSALLDLINTSSVIQDSAFALDGKTGNYDYYTLLRVNPDIRDIITGLPSAPPLSMTRIERSGWQPSDLASNETSGLFALDSSGGVSKLESAQPGSGAIVKLFQIGHSESGYALAASADSVYVAVGSKLGCIVYRYGLATKAIARRLLAVNERCVGIATDGTALYLTMPEKKEIRYWDNWDASGWHSWSLDKLGAPGYLGFDRAGHRLIVADDVSDAAYAISIPDGRTQLLSGNLGFVQSIAVSRFHILFASGKKVLFIARSDNHGENPPMGWPLLPDGHLVGAAVDSSQKLWLADYDNKIVVGPFPLI